MKRTLEADLYLAFEPTWLYTTEQAFRREAPVLKADSIRVMRVLCLEPGESSVLLTLCNVTEEGETILLQRLVGIQGNRASSAEADALDRRNWLRRAVRSAADLASAYGDIDLVGCTFQGSDALAASWFSVAAMEAAADSLPGVPVVAIFDTSSESIARQLFASARV